MVSKCANPACPATFRYLDDGKLFFAAAINKRPSSKVTHWCIAFEVKSIGAEPAKLHSKIACKDHSTMFLHLRPSRSISSSDSFGPHEPAA